MEYLPRMLGEFERAQWRHCLLLAGHGSEAVPDYRKLLEQVAATTVELSQENETFRENPDWLEACVDAWSELVEDFADV